MVDAHAAASGGVSKADGEPLCTAAAAGDVAALRALCASVPIDALAAGGVHAGRSALHVAAASGAIATAVVLVDELGANLSLPSADGRTPLDVAEEATGSPHMCNFLRRSGAQRAVVLAKEGDPDSVRPDGPAAQDGKGVESIDGIGAQATRTGSGSGKREEPDYSIWGAELREWLRGARALHGSEEVESGGGTEQATLNGVSIGRGACGVAGAARLLRKKALTARAAKEADAEPSAADAQGVAGDAARAATSPPPSPPSPPSPADGAAPSSGGGGGFSGLLDQQLVTGSAGSTGQSISGARGLLSTRALLRAPVAERTRFLVALTAGSAMRSLRRRYARFAMSLAELLPAELPADADATDVDSCAVMASALLVKLQAAGAVGAGSSFGRAGGATEGEPPGLSPRQRRGSLATGRRGSFSGGSVLLAAGTISEADLVLAEGSGADGQESTLSARRQQYGETIRLLAPAISKAAVDALFMRPLEACVPVVRHYAMMRRPVTTLLLALGNQQLVTAKAAIKTAKTLWAQGFHPREVLMAVLLEHGTPEMLGRCLATYESIEKWWNVNVQKDKQQQKRLHG